MLRGELDHMPRISLCSLKSLGQKCTEHLAVLSSSAIPIWTCRCYQSTNNIKDLTFAIQKITEKQSLFELVARHFEHFWADRNQSQRCLYSQMAIRLPCVTGKSCAWEWLLAAMGGQAALNTPSEVWHGQKYGLELTKCCVRQSDPKMLQAQTDICSEHETEHLQPPPNVCSAVLAEYHQQCSRGGCVTPITTSKLSRVAAWSITFNWNQEPCQFPTPLA